MACKNLMLIGGFTLLISAGIASAAPLSPAPARDNSAVVRVSDSQDVVRDQASGTVLHSSSGACVRTKWMSPSDTCAPAEKPKPMVHAAPPPPPPAPVKHIEMSREERTVYFAFNKAMISPEMKQRLDSLAAKLKSSGDVKGARIVGFADRIGKARYNENLSKKRAEAVREYLIAKGIINTSVADTRWLGSSESVADCPKHMKRPALIKCLQDDRRVEVEIDYMQP